VVLAHLSLEFFTKDIKISTRRLVAVTLLFSNTLVWFYVFHDHLLDALLRTPGVSLFYIGVGTVFFYSFAVFSGLIGSLISERVERRKFLSFWLAFGFLTMVSLTVFHGLEFSLLSSALLGVSFGLGFPTCQAFLTESTTFEERGRVAAVVCFIAFVMLILIFLLATELGTMGLVLTCVALIGTSFLALVIDPCRREKGPIKPWLSIMTSKTFAYYAVPWLIFQLANGISLFVSTSEFSSVATLGSAFAFIGTIFAALISGFLADTVGRKQPILIGLLMLGVSYAFFGLATTSLSYIVYLTVEGFAWGLITVSYWVVVLGDLSSGFGSKERFYALGGIFIPLLTYAVFSLVQEWSKLTVPASTLSSILSIVILASVIPVLRAPETMPEAKARARKMKEHIEKVGKLVQESKKPK
jgi:MFS family permease